MKIIEIVLLLCTLLSAQDRLNTFIEETLDRNKGLNAKEYKYLALEHKAQRQGMLPDPMLSFTQWIEPVETRVGPQQNIFSLSQKLPFPGKLSLLEKMAMTEAAGDKWMYYAALQDITYRVKINWFNLYQTDHSLGILEEYHLLLQDFVNAAAAKYATGQGIQAQVLKAQVEQSGIKSRIQELHRNRFAIQADLNQLRNRPAAYEIEAIPFIDSMIVELPVLDSLITGYEQRPEYLAAQKNWQKAELQKDYADKEWFPDLTVQANYITVGDKNSMAPDAGTDAWGVMVGINLPLWFTGRQAEQQQSQKNVLMKREQAAHIRSQIENNIADLHFRAQSTQETILLYRDILIPQAGSSLKSFLAAYRSGNLGFLELLDAERMLLQLRLIYLKEQVNYRKIIVGLEREAAIGL